VENRDQHSFEVRQHFVIPESQHHKIIGAEPAITARIAGRLRVLTAIDLDDDASLETDEISNEGPERHLPAELEVGKPAIAQCEPKLALGIGHA
jgi:hypothetical protein